jgi:hypothetical protein
MFNDIGSIAAPLLSIVTSDVLTTVFQQSYLNQSDKDDYKKIEQKDDYFTVNFDSDSWENNYEELKEGMDDNSSFQQLQMRRVAVMKFQILLNDLLIKHKASLLLYDEICQLFQHYISSANFDRFAKFKSRRSLLTSTQKTLNSKALQPINGNVKLHNNTLVTVPVFDTKDMIISLLSDPNLFWQRVSKNKNIRD